MCLSQSSRKQHRGLGTVQPARSLGPALPQQPQAGLEIRPTDTADPDPSRDFRTAPQCCYKYPNGPWQKKRLPPQRTGKQPIFTRCHGDQQALGSPANSDFHALSMLSPWARSSHGPPSAFAPLLPSQEAETQDAPPSPKVRLPWERPRMDTGLSTLPHLLKWPLNIALKAVGARLVLRGPASSDHPCGSGWTQQGHQAPRPRLVDSKVSSV